MEEREYDIFISYRRDGGAQFARILQLGLEKRGYRVFLDYDELTDGIFGEHIKKAIHSAPIFMPILSAHYLDRCKNEGDWVREEISLAIKLEKQIVPVDPDKSFNGFPPGVPEDIQQAIGSHLYSDIYFGQMMNASIDEMVKKRIQPLLKTDPPSGKWKLILGVVVVVAVVVSGYLLLKNDSTETASLSKSYSEQLVKAAKCGNPLAQYYLALAYENSYGVTANSHEAVTWYRRAAEQSLDSAQVNLALCYLSGNGVKKDTDTGIEWLTRAAEQGGKAERV